MGKQEIIFLLSVCLKMSFLSFLPSSLTSFSILPNLKLSVPCLLASIIGDENLMLFSSVVNPRFFPQDIFGRFFFFFSVSSVMKFQENMPGFLIFFFFLDILGSILKVYGFFISAKWSSIIFYSISFVLSEILNLCLSHFCIFSFIVHRNYSNFFRTFIANFWQFYYFLRNLSWFWNFIAYH